MNLERANEVYAKASLLIRQLGIGGRLAGHYYLVTGIADYSLRRYPLSKPHVMYGWIAAKHGTTKASVRRRSAYAYQLMRKRSARMLETVLGHPPAEKPDLQELLVCCSQWIDTHNYHEDSLCWTSSGTGPITITFPISYQ